MSEATALERTRLVIRGVRAELVLEDGGVTLTKEGPPPTTVTFSVGQVRGIVIEPASRGGRGWVHISVVGGSSSPPGELAAMSDPYTLPLTSRSAVTARRLARLVEKHVHERGLPSEPAFADAAPASGRFSSAVTLTRGPGTIEPAPEPSLAPSPAAERGPVVLPTPAFASPSVTLPELVVAPAVRSEVRPATVAAPFDGPSDLDPRPLSEADERAALTPPPPPSPTPLLPPPVGPPLAAIERGRALATQLGQLGDLHAAGVLTDAEFEQAKGRVLDG